MLQISFKYQHSIIARIMNWLFIDKNISYFKQSKIIKLLDYLSKPHLSFILLSIAIGLLFYQYILPTSFIDYKLWFIAACLALLFCDKKSLKSLRSIWFLLLFIVISAISSLLASLGGQPFLVVANGLFLITIFPLFFIVGTSLSKKLQKVLVGVVLAMALPLLLAGLFQYFFGELAPAYWVSSAETLISNRAFGWSSNPNNLGNLAMVTSLLSLFVGWFNKKHRLYLCLYSFLAFIVLLLTFSRTNWLAWGLALFIFLSLKNWRYLWLSTSGLIIFIFPGFRQRLLVIFSPDFLQNSIAESRLWALFSNLDIFKKAPLLGVGPGSYGNGVAIDQISSVYRLLPQDGFVATFMVDMQWPQILAQTGLLGALTIVGFIASYLVNSFRSYRRSTNPICIASIALLIAMLLIGCLESVWYFAPMASLFGVFLGIGAGYNYESK